jgi:hypothetical protein
VLAGKPQIIVHFFALFQKPPFSRCMAS